MGDSKQRFGRPLRHFHWLVFPVCYAAFLAWQEWHFRQNMASPLPSVVMTTPAVVRESLDTTAVATVLGLATEMAPLPSAEPLTLQASFVLGTGLSRALLADAQGPRMYTVGERLPGGSILRRVEANQVVLWNKGREELLTLQPAVARFLRRLDPRHAPQTPAISARYLRPLSGQPE